MIIIYDDQNIKIQDFKKPINKLLSFILQVDLIDMRHVPDDEYKYILHGIGHFTRFNFLSALEGKDSSIIADHLMKIFSQFGPPKIYHSNNGREFVNQAIKNILDNWPEQVQMVQGRPRHPQTQGMVEQAHINVETKIAAKTKDLTNDEKPTWSKWLPHICCKLLLFLPVHDNALQVIWISACS